MADTQKWSSDIPYFLVNPGVNGTSLQLRKRAVLYTQGDQADSVWYVQSGRIQLAVTSHHGKEAITGILGPGDFLGEACLAGQAWRLSTATALIDSIVLRFEKSAIFRLMRSDYTFAEIFFKYLLARNMRIEEDLVDHLFNSSEKRLARVLLLLANLGNQRQPGLIVPKISQETLAAMVGTTRARVSFFMTRFRKLGFIEYDGGIKVNDTLVSVILGE